jgi:hypothetical protein
MNLRRAKMVEGDPVICQTCGSKLGAIRGERPRALLPKLQLERRDNFFPADPA